jgi:tetratricopeptide (TPR) repeat protein
MAKGRREGAGANATSGERRRYPRLATMSRVEFEQRGKSVFRFISDISPGGVGVRTDDPLSIGTELDLRLFLSGKEPIALVGTVVSGGRGMMGVRFDERDGKALSRVVERYLELSLSRVESRLRFNPDDAASLCAVGDAHRAVGRLDDAFPYYERAARANPRSALAQLCFGAVLVETAERDGRIDRWQAAAAALEACLAVEPLDEAKKLLARARKAISKHETAAREEAGRREREETQKRLALEAEERRLRGERRTLRASKTRLVAARKKLAAEVAAFEARSADSARRLSEAWKRLRDRARLERAKPAAPAAASRPRRRPTPTRPKRRRKKPPLRAALAAARRIEQLLQSLTARKPRRKRRKR